MQNDNLKCKINFIIAYFKFFIVILIFDFSILIFFVAGKGFEGAEAPAATQGFSPFPRKKFQTSFSIFVAGKGFEPLTSRLWAWRAA